MKRYILAAALAGIAGTSGADTIPGYDRMDVRAAHRAYPLAVSVWYPAGSPTYRVKIGDSLLFDGAPAFVGAAIEDGHFPLFVLSHGSGGNMDALAWLSSGLAQHGAIVLAVNHPGTTSGDSSPRRTVRLDERAADLSAALDALLADPAFGRHVDPARITALGFSLGGATALGLAGLRFDPGAYADYCATMAQDCIFLAKGGVDLTALPPGFAADTRDARITAAVAVDPGFTFAATAESVAALEVPVELINLGNDNRLYAGNVGQTGSALAARLPDARYTVIAPASHFTFLATCKDGGAEMLEEEGDDPICTDPPGADRSLVHRQLIEAIVAGAGL